MAIDKAAANAAILKEHNPAVEVIAADLAADDGWQDKLPGLDARLHAQAQIGGLVQSEFVRNTITASERVIEAAVERWMTGADTIIGLDRIDYIDLIRAMKRATQVRTQIVRIPYRLFALLLRIFGLFSKSPPFADRRGRACHGRTHR